MFGKAFRIAAGAGALAVLVLSLYLSGFGRPNTAHAAGTDDQPWFMSIMDWSWIKEQVEHFRSNDDREVKAFEGVAASVDSLSQTQKEILEQEKIQAEEAQKQTELEKIKVEEEKKQTGFMEKMAKWFDKCGCVPWSMPRTGGGGGDHRHDPDPTPVPAPTQVPCTMVAYRFCEGNTLVTVCSDLRQIRTECLTCVTSTDKGGYAYCEGPTATSTAHPVATATPIPATAVPPTTKPATATPPPVVRTPEVICMEAPHWVCRRGYWYWVACGVVLCPPVRCTYGCDEGASHGYCYLQDPTAVPVTATSGPGPSATPTATSTSTRTPTPGHGPTLTRTATSVPNPTDVPPTSPPATLPIASATPTQVRIPTATLTGPPTATLSHLCDANSTSVARDNSVDGKMHPDPIGGGEPCGFKWNSKNLNPLPMRCKDGYECTFTMNQVNGADIEPGVFVLYGDVLPDGWWFTVLSATFRWIKGHPAGDAVHNRCQLLVNERIWGLDSKHANPIEVFPFGFDCSGTSLITTDTGHVCPAFGMSKAQTYPLLLEPGTGKCKLPWQTHMRAGNVPDGWRLQNDKGFHDPSTYVETIIATFWPQ